MVRAPNFCYLSKNLDSEEDVSVFLASVSSSLEEAISRISSRKIISRTYNFLNREMGILINFMNILGAGPKLK